MPVIVPECLPMFAIVFILYDIYDIVVKTYYYIWKMGERSNGIRNYSLSIRRNILHPNIFILDKYLSSASISLIDTV